MQQVLRDRCKGRNFFRTMIVSGYEKNFLMFLHTLKFLPSWEKYSNFSTFSLRDVRIIFEKERKGNKVTSVEVKVSRFETRSSGSFYGLFSPREIVSVWIIDNLSLDVDTVTLFAVCILSLEFRLCCKYVSLVNWKTIFFPEPRRS